MRFTLPSVSAADLVSADGQSDVVDSVVVSVVASELLSLQAERARSETNATASSLDIFFVLFAVLRMAHRITHTGNENIENM